jgi:hypothetical protein
MSGRIHRVRHAFVKFIPEVLGDGILYISCEYKVVAHRCCCGCGEKVDTPLSPAGWELTFNGETVSLWPSIAGGRCRSHYIIRRGAVQWVAPLTRAQDSIALERDLAAAQSLSQPSHSGAGAEVGKRSRSRPWWRRLLGRLRAMRN